MCLNIFFNENLHYHSIYTYGKTTFKINLEIGPYHILGHAFRGVDNENSLLRIPV